MMLEKLCEAKKVLHPEKNITGLKGKQQLGGRSRPERQRMEPHNFVVPDKENIPKKMKPKSVKASLFIQQYSDCTLAITEF